MRKTNTYLHSFNLKLCETTKFDVFKIYTGLETHGGPGAIGPRIFQMAPHFLRSGPKIVEPPTYILHVRAPGLWFGPPQKKIEFRAL